MPDVGLTQSISHEAGIILRMSDNWCVYHRVPGNGDWSSANTGHFKHDWCQCRCQTQQNGRVVQLLQHYTLWTIKNVTLFVCPITQSHICQCS